ncbi:AAA family ATPase [Bradyrhizobium hipponense]|uniref:AAA family ATPase n=1 Tax=Bradyrhizobium hipponense TaxID=2605638 RepID=UPI001F314C7D|nr:AAA family ATPase [Bradyrhizobium hipponense]
MKIAITGTHSSGKTTFLERLKQELEGEGLRIHSIGDFARRAKDLGFPILKKHTYESTLWIMAECLRCEAEASLQSDLILVDRPVIDALGYLQAALQVSGRTLDSRRSKELMTIATAHTPDYDVLIRTALDSNIEVGAGRDLDGEFRMAAATAIERLVSQIEPNALILTSANGKELVQRVVEIVRSRLTAVRPQ